MTIPSQCLFSIILLVAHMIFGQVEGFLFVGSVKRLARQACEYFYLKVNLGPVG
jgi:hypothetical protein